MGVNAGMESVAKIERIAKPTPVEPEKPHINDDMIKKPKNSDDLDFSPEQYQKHWDKMDIAWLISYYMQSSSDFLHHTFGDKATMFMFEYVIEPGSKYISYLIVPMMITVNQFMQTIGSLFWVFAYPILAVTFFSGDPDGKLRDEAANGNDNPDIFAKIIFWSYKFCYQAQLIVNLGDVQKLASTSITDLDPSTIAWEFLVQWLLIIPNILAVVFYLILLLAGDNIKGTFQTLFSKNWFAGIKRWKD